MRTKLITRMLLLGWMGWCIFGFVSPVMASKTNTIHRFALLMGHNNKGGRLSKLRFAVSDTRKMRDVLRQVAGYDNSRIWLLANPNLKKVKQTFVTIQQQINQLKRKSPKASILLLVYYSGHAQKGKFLLGQEELPFRELHNFLRTSHATLKLAILDACETGGLTRQKGLRRRKRGFHVPFLHLAPTAKGEVIITATGERESAHEDPALRGGIFTHFWVTGLRGAADRDRDGHVTLQEAYRYAYARTLERTILSIHGPQRAHFRKQISGFGQLILATINKPKAWLHLRRDLKGRFFIWNTRRDMLLAELRKNKGQATTIALIPGRYVLQWRRRGGVYTNKISLRKGQRLHLRVMGRRLAYTHHATRGGTVEDPPVSSLNWKVFRGQMDGPSLDVKYQLGWSGLAQGILHHGPTFSILHPLYGALKGNASFLLRLTYQNGNYTNDRFGYDLHLFHIDAGLMWHAIHQRNWLVGLGLRVRFAPILQNILPKPDRPSASFWSAALGTGLLCNVQYGLSHRWFISGDLDAGIRILNLANSWTARWTLGFSLGIGIRI